MSSLRRYLFGYDVFISYSRKDASLYAASLANRLTDKGISCFIDQWGTEPGEDLPKGLKRTLVNSRILVLLSTHEAIASKSVEKEINVFFTQRERYHNPD